MDRFSTNPKSPVHGFTLPTLPDRFVVRIEYWPTTCTCRDLGYHTMYLMSLFPIMQLFDICDFPSKKLYLGYVQKYWFIHVTHLQLFTTLQILKLSCLNVTFWNLNGAEGSWVTKFKINQDMSYVTPLLHVFTLFLTCLFRPEVGFIILWKISAL